MARPLVRGIVAAGAVIGLVACGDAVDVSKPIAFSGADAELLYQDIQFSFLHAEINPRSGSSQADGLGRPYLDCGNGGSVAFYGTDFSNPITSKYEMDAVYQDCNTSHFVLNGTYHQSFAASDSGQQPFQTVGGTGSVAVKRLRDGTSGSCDMDFHVTVAYNGVFADGTICGVEATNAFDGDGNHTSSPDVTRPNLRRTPG